MIQERDLYHHRSPIRYTRTDATLQPFPGGSQVTTAPMLCPICVEWGILPEQPTWKRQSATWLFCPKCVVAWYTDEEWGRYNWYTSQVYICQLPDSGKFPRKCRNCEGFPFVWHSFSGRWWLAYALQVNGMVYILPTTGGHNDY